MKTLYIVPIEPIDQRYTKQWYENIHCFWVVDVPGVINHTPLSFSLELIVLIGYTTDANV